LRRAAQALGRGGEAAHYADYAGELGEAFEQEFASAHGYGSGRQVTGILPLAFGLVPDERRGVVAAALVDRIVDHDSGHLDTGIFGTRFLIDALVAAGRPDVALAALDQTTYPGYGYQIEHGATTAWEQWVYSSAMESHDHAMFTGINASLITAFAGIRPTGPGYETIEIAPAPPAGLERAAASLQTVRGELASSWQRSAGGLTLAVTVPANATAQVHLPVQPGDEVSESGVPAVESPGVSLVEEEDEGARVYAVGSGEYLFTVAPGAGESEEGESELNGGEKPAAGEQGAIPVGRSAAPAFVRAPPRPRLTMAARSRSRHRATVTIACRRGCSRRLLHRRVRVTVARCGHRGPVLARVRARFSKRRIKFVVHSRRRPIPPRLGVRIVGLGGDAIVRCLRLHRSR